MKKLFTDLSNLSGISGDEQQVKEYLLQALSPHDRVIPDRLGNLIIRGKSSGKGSKIMLAAHMDEIGFLSGYITKDGFIEMIPIGGWYPPVALGGKVLLKTREKQLTGIITSIPPHLLDTDQRKKPLEMKHLYIDIGAKNRQEVMEKYQVTPNTPISPFPDSGTLNSSKILYGKAWDDRVGCAALIETFSSLSSKIPDNEIYYVGTVQEEVGIRGAKTAANIVEPDVAIVLEVSVAQDYPGGKEESPVKLGEGVSISYYDRSMITDRKLFQYTVDLAHKNHIKYHLNYSLSGGTDGGSIHLSQQGIPTIVLGVPTRYIHSFYGIFHLDDFKEMVRLISIFCGDFSKQSLENT